MDKYLCERCGKELVFRCAYSRIDHKLICVECDDKEQPKELAKKIADLEAELAESEKDLEIVCVEGKDKIREYCEITNTQQEEIFKLKHQLAESKEQLIAMNEKRNKIKKESYYLKQQLQEEKNRNKKLNHEAQKYYEDAYCNGFQNQKAIEELEKLKRDIWTNQHDDGLLDEQVDIYELTEMIDQQIKSLKGE